jgi:hypothetical protein
VQVIGPQERTARPEHAPSGPDAAVGRVRDCFFCFSSKIGARQIVSPMATEEVKRRWTIGVGRRREQRLSVERSTGGRTDAALDHADATYEIRENNCQWEWSSTRRQANPAVLRRFSSSFTRAGINLPKATVGGEVRDRIMYTCTTIR